MTDMRLNTETTTQRMSLLGVLTAWVLLAAALGAASVRAETSADLPAALQQLKDTPLAQMTEAVDKMAAVRDARVPKILKALLEGQLFYRKSDGKVVTALPADEGYAITDALTGEALGTVGRFDVKKLAINNNLRNTLTGAIARLELTVGDPQQRLRAVRSMGENLDADTVALLRSQQGAESDPIVRRAIEMALAMADLAGSDKEARLAALRSLDGSLDQEVRNRLSALLETDDDGNYLEADADVRNTADAMIKRIEFKVQLNQLVETLFFGLSLGAVLVLSAIGLAITFGVMGVINMAHGELMMIGAYTTYVVQLLMPGALDWSLLVAVPSAFVIAGLFGIAIERGIIRVLYGRPLETLLATFGVSLFLQQLVRSVFSPLNRSVSTPGWMSGSVEINSALSLTLNRLYIIVFSLLVFVALLAILKRTRLGLEVRAVAQNRAMARAMGIRTGWVDALTFGLGSGIAGVAGVALSQLTNVGPNLGQAYIVDSFMVVVFGGVGNLWGTLVGGIGLGVVNKLLEPYAGAVLAKILILVFIIVFIQKRPRGLFPQKGRAVEG